MKRIIGLGVLVFLSMVMLVVAGDCKTCEVDSDCKSNDCNNGACACERESECESGYGCQSGLCKTSGGSGFVLNGNFSYFGLQSAYEGWGFGVDLPKTIFWDRTIYLSQSDLRQVTIKAKLSNLTWEYGFGLVHFKQLFTPKDYSGYKELNSFELLSTYSPDAIGGYGVIIRVNEEDVNEPKDVLMLLDNKKGVKELSVEFLDNDLTGYHYKVTLPDAGLVTMVTKDGTAISLPKVEEPLNEEVVELDDFFVEQTDTLDA
tara:strand:+ start:2128 stop:2907 length:780 start_codon:yes stop_codon:yes gene_type:complete